MGIESEELLYREKEEILTRLSTALSEAEDLRRRVISHIKGESCKHFCRECRKPIWFVDDEDMTCPFCGATGFPVPDIDAVQIL